MRAGSARARMIFPFAWIKEHNRKAFPIVIVLAILLWSMASTIQTVEAAVLFSNGFESGNFNGWNGRGTSTGETASVVNTLSHHGSYSGRFYSNGNGNYETAYSYKSVAASDEIWTRCYIYVSRSGINSVGDRIFFTILRSGTDNVAYAGWKMDTDGKIKWVLTVNTGLPSNPSYHDIWYVAVPDRDSPPQLPSPSLNRWYSVEVGWRRGLSPSEGGPMGYSGGIDLYVNGQWAISDMRYQASIQYYNPVSTVRFGLAEQYGCTSTIVYLDCSAIGTSRIGIQGPVPAITSFSASPNPFTPNGNGINDYTTISSTFNTVAKWQLIVKNALGQVYLSNWGDGQTMKRVWNEETTSYPLIDGTYTATLSITDVLGNNPSSRSIAVTVSNARPTVYAWMSYYSFSPSAGQVTGLYYSLSESCYVTVRFYNSAGSSMRTLLNNALIPSGEHSLIWDGRSSTGAIVPLGDYRVRLYATDTSGNRATPYYPITILVTVT